MAVPEVFAVSFAGRSHIATGRVNQDAAGAIGASGVAPQLLGSAATCPIPPELSPHWGQPLPDEAVALSVADGHGSERYDQSHVGSALAVMLGLVQCSHLAQSETVPDAATEWLEVELPRRVAQQWRRVVLGQTQSSDGDEVELVKRHGTTLLCCLIAREWSLFFQIGDGEIVAVESCGTVHQPVPEVIRHLGTETDSLAIDADGSSFRVARLPFGSAALSTVALATDGLTNGFASRDGMTELVQNIDEGLRSSGALTAHWRRQIERTVARSSRFTGDDVSFGLAHFGKESSSD